MEPPIIEMEEVSFAYNGQPVLQEVSLAIPRGDFVAVIGPNGGGKTTLLRLMLGLLKPDTGRVRLLGRPAGLATHHIGYVRQDVHINQNFPISALEVVLMGKRDPRRRWGHHGAQDRREALQTLERMGMAAFAKRRIGELSGGQRQRVFIARALVTRPQLLLLDEPTASIDTKGQADFYRMLKELNDEVTILVVSHDLLVISTYVKSVACVNKHLHYHQQAEITGQMMETMYPCTVEEVCPVELVAHGLPHRVLQPHEE
jgi:zinc transport system ATP-binding protein